MGCFMASLSDGEQNLNRRYRREERRLSCTWPVLLAADGTPQASGGPSDWSPHASNSFLTNVLLLSSLLRAPAGRSRRGGVRHFVSCLPTSRPTLQFGNPRGRRSDRHLGCLPISLSSHNSPNLFGDQRFESGLLQRRVACEPHFPAFDRVRLTCKSVRPLAEALQKRQPHVFPR